MVYPEDGNRRTPLIEGSPITVCKRCGCPFCSVVIDVCPQCDLDQWATYSTVLTPDEKRFIEREKFIKVVDNG